MNTRKLLRAVIGTALVTTWGWSGAYAASEGGASTPKLSDGRPDLSGTWIDAESYENLPAVKGKDGSVCVMCLPQKDGKTVVPAAFTKPGRPNYKPEYQAKVKELDQRQVEFDPALRCKNPGLPRIGVPDKIVHKPGELVFLYDDLSGSFFRIIPTDGRPHRDDVEASYLGDSVGKWEGDTLVIETVNLLDDSWLSDDGAFHTPDLKVIERLRRVGNQIEYQATAYDPAVLAEPFALRPRILQPAPAEMVEPAPCIEQDLKHIVDGTHHDNPR